MKWSIFVECLEMRRYFIGDICRNNRHVPSYILNVSMHILVSFSYFFPSRFYVLLCLVARSWQWRLVLCQSKTEHIVATPASITGKSVQICNDLCNDSRSTFRSHIDARELLTRLWAMKTSGRIPGQVEAGQTSRGQISIYVLSKRFLSSLR